MEIKLYELNETDVFAEMLERYTDYNLGEYKYQCILFINKWKRRVENMQYQFIAHKEFNMDFLNSIRDKVEKHFNPEEPKEIKPPKAKKEYVPTELFPNN